MRRRVEVRKRLWERIRARAKLVHFLLQHGNGLALLLRFRDVDPQIDHSRGNCVMCLGKLLHRSLNRIDGRAQTIDDQCLLLSACYFRLLHGGDFCLHFLLAATCLRNLRAELLNVLLMPLLELREVLHSRETSFQLRVKLLQLILELLRLLLEQLKLLKRLLLLMLLQLLNLLKFLVKLLRLLLQLLKPGLCPLRHTI